MSRSCRGCRTPRPSARCGPRRADDDRAAASAPRRRSLWWNGLVPCRVAPRRRPSNRDSALVHPDRQVGAPTNVRTSTLPDSGPAHVFYAVVDPDRSQRAGGSRVVGGLVASSSGPGVQAQYAPTVECPPPPKVVDRAAASRSTSRWLSWRGHATGKNPVDHLGRTPSPRHRAVANRLGSPRVPGTTGRCATASGTGGSREARKRGAHGFAFAILRTFSRWRSMALARALDRSLRASRRAASGVAV